MVGKLLSSLLHWVKYLIICNGI